ncbi:hypothetical protein AAES_57573 [Amazona aestiva]|uniref:Uncharacterized protein n=1 Tax=Amazona aestiva TaxID=12930 RepID=A0A0Q3TSL9_AMAAE|nr:hypothetical protein AAES_57573 [Amazona aestiva]
MCRHPHPAINHTEAICTQQALCDQTEEAHDAMGTGALSGIRRQIRYILDLISFWPLNMMYLCLSSTREEQVFLQPQMNLARYQFEAPVYSPGRCKRLLKLPFVQIAVILQQSENIKGNGVVGYFLVNTDLPYQDRGADVRDQKRTPTESCHGGKKMLYCKENAI